MGGVFLLTDGWIGAPTVLSEIPNANVALFDLAFPGSQPVSVYEDDLLRRTMRR